MKMANYCGKVYLFVVHDVDEPQLLDNDLKKVVGYCHGLLERRDNSHVNCVVEDKEGNKGDEVEVDLQVTLYTMTIKRAT